MPKPDHQRRPAVSEPAVPPNDADVQGHGQGGSRWVLLATLAVWLLVSWPLASGQRTLFLRDVFGVHQPLWASGARALATHEIPALDPSRGLGQPYSGNPQAQAFYPSRLLGLVLPFWTAFNLHYVLHWLLALFTMTALGRRLRLSPSAALVAGLAWAGGGWMLTCLSFAHTLVVSAWWPLVVWGVLGTTRRSLAVAALAGGLALLGGEPLVAALLVAPLIVLACATHAWRRGLARCAAALLAGVLVALPQIVATVRILPGIVRGHVTMATSEFSLAPQRLIELFLPLPWGWPGEVGPLMWKTGFALRPLIYSLSIGIVAFALVINTRVTAGGQVGAGRRPAYLAGLAGLALAGYALAWLGGLAPGAVAALTLDLFRYSEKFLVWPAFTLPLLAGVGLDQALREGRSRRCRALGWTLLVLALPLALASRQVVGYAVRWLLDRSLPAPAATFDRLDLIALLACVGLSTGGLLLLATAAAIARRRPAMVAGLQLVSLLALFPLVATMELAPLRVLPAAAAGLPPGAGVFDSARAYPAWHADPGYAVPVGSRAVYSVLAAATLGPVPGTLLGTTNPLAGDVDGLSWARSANLSILLAATAWPGRITWLRVLGVERAVLHGVPWVDGWRSETPRSASGLASETLERQPPAGLRRRAQLHLAGRDVDLYDVVDPVPLIWWPDDVQVVAQHEQLVAAVGRLADPARTVIAELAIPHQPGGSVAVIEVGADRLRWQVRGNGGLTAVRRAWNPLWLAKLEDGSRLPVGPVDLVLTGVVVPAGEHTVTLEVDRRPEGWAGALAGLVTLALLVVSLRGAAPTRAAVAKALPASGVG